VAGGWWKEKLAGWRWLWRNREWIRERRARIQRERTVSDRALAPLMTDHLDAKNHPMPDALRPLDDLLAAYWRFARRLVARGSAPAPSRTTAETAYADRLVSLQGARWKQVVDVQAPYRWNLRRLRLGRTLDVGCGIGRNLHNLGGTGVGVDHNADAVAVARERGYEAYTTAEFAASKAAEAGAFDSVLFAHVLEHMTRNEATDLVRAYLPYVRRGGRVVMITPQERGFRTDATHVELLDFDALAAIAGELGLTVSRRYSFPFPREAGRVFPYNEFVVVAATA
jgi:SAM-dependent methyltransferase